jgi:L-amino acid N-acyltransferase YncA
VGTYKNGISKHVAVKNEDAASVHARAEFLRMQAGRKARPFYPIVHAEKQSVQGFWTPELLKALVAEQK